MTTETTTQERISYSGVTGLIIGLLLSAFYGLSTIGPVNFPNSDLTAFGLFVASLIFGVIGLNTQPRYSSNYRLGGHFEQVIDPSWNPPSSFTTAMGLSTIPIWLGTLGYVVGIWTGLWS